MRSGHWFQKALKESIEKNQEPRVWEVVTVSIKDYPFQNGCTTANARIYGAESKRNQTHRNISFTVIPSWPSSWVVSMPTSAASMSMSLSTGELRPLRYLFVGSFHFPSINPLLREEINAETSPPNCSFQQSSNFELHKNWTVVPCP